MDANDTQDARRPTILLEEEQLTRLIDRVANTAADAAIRRALDHVYTQVGKTVVSRVLWAIGAVVVGAYLYLSGQKH